MGFGKPSTEGLYNGAIEPILTYGVRCGRKP